MKIFLLASSFPNYDAPMRGIFNFRFVKQVEQLGHQVFVVFFRMWTPSRRLISSYFYDNIKVTQVCLPLMPPGTYFSTKANNLICRFFGWLVLKKSLKDSDIIHSVYLTSNGIIAGYWAKKLKMPHVAQAIGSDVNSDMKIFVGKKGNRKWMKNIDGIITNSMDLERSIKKYFVSSPEIETIYRGSQIKELQRDSDLENKGAAFLYLGGLESNKSLEFGINTKGGITLMAAWKKAEIELFSSNATLYFGGPGFDNNIITKWKSGLEHPENVHLIGKIDPDDVKEYLYKSDMAIIPSMEEGLPNFLMESNANGKPAIGSTAGGIPEVILDNETGYIFEKGDVNALAGLLIKSAKENDQNRMMGRAAYRRIKTFFNADNYSYKVLDFYKKIMDQCAG